MKCSICKKAQAIEGKYKCESCTAIVSERNRRYWKDKKALIAKKKSNTCTRCNKRPFAQGSTSRCEECLEYARRKQLEYRGK